MTESQEQPLFKRIKKQMILLKVVQHFLFEKPNIIVHLKKHYELMQVLKPFRKAKLINFRTYVIYLFSFISRSLNVHEKLQILNYNYSFLKNIFNSNQLNQLFKEGIEFYKESSDEDDYTVVLTYSSILEFEGSLSLFFKVNNVKIFTLSFTFAPGEIFKSNNETVIYISCLQGVKNQFGNISKTTKYFQDIIPPVILLKALEAFAVSLKIKEILGILAKDQLSFDDEMDYESFYSNYDNFWKNSGGRLINGNYVLTCPITQKSISLIRQNHRNRTIKKRQKLNDVYTACYEKMINILFLPLIDILACDISFYLCELSA